MIKCDCLDPERHGHLDDCPLAEIESLRARLARELDGIAVLEKVIVERGARLAEATRLLQTAYGMGWIIDENLDDEIGDFLNVSTVVIADSATHRESGVKP